MYTVQGFLVYVNTPFKYGGSHSADSECQNLVCTGSLNTTGQQVMSKFLTFCVPPLESAEQCIISLTASQPLLIFLVFC